MVRVIFSTLAAGRHGVSAVGSDAGLAGASVLEDGVVVAIVGGVAAADVADLDTVVSC